MLRPLILPLMVFFVSCSSRPGQNQTTKDTIQMSNIVQQDTATRQDSTVVKNSSGDTLIVDQLCAVFYIADSAQAEKKKKMVGTDSTYGGVDDANDDNAYYMGQATEFLDKHKVKILSVDDKKYILFKSPGNVSHLIKTDTLEELVDVFLFNPRKGFVNANILNIEGDYNKILK